MELFRKRERTGRQMGDDVFIERTGGCLIEGLNIKNHA